MEKVLFVFFPDLCEGEGFRVLYEGHGTFYGNPCAEKIIALDCSIEYFSDHLLYVSESHKANCCNYEPDEVAYWEHLSDVAQRTEDDFEAPKSLYRKAVKVCGRDIENDEYIYLQWMLC